MDMDQKQWTMKEDQCTIFTVNAFQLSENLLEDSLFSHRHFLFDLKSL